MFFKRARSTSLDAQDAEDIARNLHREFVLERCGKGFYDETNSLRPEVKHIFAAKVDRYREAMLLAALIGEAQEHREWKTVLWYCEEIVFDLTPPESVPQKRDEVRSAMADLGRLLNPDFKGELRWGFEWFRDVGDDAIARNPIRLFQFVSTWMDEYIALVKTIRQARRSLNVRDGEISALVYDGFDEPGLTELLEHWGLSVLRVTTARDAERGLRLREFDLIILESWDPYIRAHIDGFAKFSAHILFLDFEGRNHAFLSSKGYTHILDKPVDPASLREHVQALIGEKTLSPLADGASS
jgi:hypothetical protein